MPTSNRKRKLNKRHLAILLILTACIVLLTFLAVHFAKVGLPGPILFTLEMDLPGSGTLQLRSSVDEVLGVPLHEKFIENGIPGRPGDIREIKYIVIHETDNEEPTATARAHANFLANGGDGRATSWHYSVDDSEIYQHVPDNEIAFHAGDKRKADGGNKCGIGVEICVNGDYEKAFTNAAKLTSFLLKAYNLDIDSVKRHGDFIDKDCPLIMQKYKRWDEFKQKVSEYM